jgi:GalNAc-alpha-(1->4)-GalNAc-alpha-(1->3)-diNAcBac-PP-undecaprenol alpha-1,4-N-acetyl-D-galactosaminyltransferase
MKSDIIYIIIQNLNIGGAERSALYLYESLKKAGYDVRLLETDKLCSPQIGASAMKKAINRIRKVICLRSALMRNETNTVISFMYHTSLLTFAATRFLRIQTICCERSNPFKSKRGVLLNFLTKIIYQRSDVVVVQTDILKDHLYERWNVNNIRVIPNFAPEVKNVRIKKKEQVKKIICVSRLVPSKNVNLIIQALKRVLSKNIRLVIYGNGPEHSKLENQIENLNLEEFITIITHENKIEAMYGDADIFVSLSEVEGFPNVLLEAFAFGVPVISYNCDYGPSEILEKGLLGLLLTTLELEEIEEKISNLIYDTERRYNYSVGGLLKIEKDYTSNKILKKWQNLLN